MRTRMTSIKIVLLALELMLAGGLFSHAVAANAEAPQHAPAAANGCSDLINNGSFETGSFSSWGTSGGPWIANYLAHHGTYSGVVGGGDDRNDIFYQQVTIPSNADSATLTYWWYIYTQDSNIHPYDYLYVEVRNTSGTVLATLETLANTSTTGTWQQSTFALPDFIGQTIQIAFHGTTDGSLFTSFYIDEVELEVCEPTCPIDSWEPNDSFAAAYGPISTGIAHCGAYICPSHDEDWFKFNVTSGQQITVDLDSLPANFDLYLYNPSGSLVGQSTNSGTTAERIVHTASMTGDYGAYVYGWGGAYSDEDDYCLLVTLSAAPTATPTVTPTKTPTPTSTLTHTPTGTPTPTSTPRPTDTPVPAPTDTPTATSTPTPTTTAIHTPTATPTATATHTATATPTATSACPDPEDPVDDDPAGATPLTLETTYVAHICSPSDVDYFSLWIHQGDTITADLFNVPNLPANYALELYLDPAAPPVASSDRSGQQAEQIVYTSNWSHTYYLKVFGSGPSDFNVNVPYLLRATAGAPTPTTTPGCPDTHEPNDSFAQAGLAPSGANFTSYICTSTDLDYWKIPGVSLGQIIQVNLTELPQDYDLLLYKPDQQTVAAQSTTRGTGNETIEYTTDVEGEYWYILVYGYQGAHDETNPYRLAVTVSDAPTCAPDQLEPNNDADHANAFTKVDNTTETKSNLSICPAGDGDWFSVNLDADARIIAEITHNLAQGPVRMYLVHPDGTTIMRWTWGIADTERIDHIVSTAGLYYLLVEAATPGDTNPNYSVSVTVHRPTPTPTATPTCRPDHLEPNDSPIQAKFLVQPYTTVITTGLSICTGDVDWFLAGLNAHDTLIADIYFRNAGGDLNMALYDFADPMTPVEPPLAESDSVTDNEHIEYESLEDWASYYIKVYPATPGGENHNYDLKLQVVAPTHTPTPTSTPTATPTSTPIVCPPDVPKLDLELLDMEVTQSIQNLDNDVPLVGYKATYVRLYVVGSQRKFLDKRITGYLTATHAGAPLDPSQTPCYGYQRNVDIITNYSKLPLPGRAWAYLGLYCYLPRSWRQPNRTITIRGHVQPPQGYCDPDLRDNEKDVHATFGPEQTLTIRAVQVREGCKDPSCGPLYDDYKNVHKLAERMFPVHYVTLIPHHGDYVDWVGSNETLGKLFDQYVKDPAAGCNRRDCVVVGYKKTGDWFTAGAAWRGLRVAWVRTDAPDQHQEDLAHELGHAVGGLGHVRGCWFPDEPFENYPYPGTKLSNGGDRDYWGLDTWGSPPSVRDPNTHGDVMSYCRPKWISDYSYRLMMSGLSTSMALSADAVTLQPDLDYLVAIGQINPETQAVSLRPMMRLPGSALNPVQDSQPDDPYAAQLLDGDGVVLAERTFSLIQGSDLPPESDESFAVLVPYHSAAARFAITHHGEEIYSLDVSPNAPTVSVHPVTGTITDTLTVSWSADDLDGDSLTSEVYFSADGGETWELLTSGIEDTKAEFDTSFWPETEQGMVRVLVTDGVNTSQDVTGPFTVTTKAPVVFVAAPEDGSGVPPETPILFTASGYDAEDGPMEGDVFSWSSDRDGNLGTGEEVFVPELSPGWHEITVAATDSDGHIATDSIRVYVGHWVYLPLILKNHHPGPAPTHTPTPTGTHTPTATPTAILTPTPTPTITPTSPVTGIRYVAPTGNDTDNACTNSSTPCRTIQRGVDQAQSGEEVRVAAGTYSGTQTVTITQSGYPYTYTQVAIITKSLTLLGGYSTGNWTTSNPIANPTIIDAQQQGRGITIFGDGSQTVTVDGFTITGGDYTGLGNPPGDWHLCRRTGADCGGGLFARWVTVVVRNCTVTDNVASRTRHSSDGGGIYLWDLSPGSRIENVTVSDNRATSEGGEGGGILIVDGHGVTIVHSTLEGNCAVAAGGGMVINAPDYSAVVIEDTTFISNTVSGGDAEGGGLHASLAREGEALRMDRVRMQGNQAKSQGAAIYLSKVGGGLTTARLTNLLLAGNRTGSAAATDSVLTVDRGYDMALTLAHVTAADNPAPTFLRTVGPEAGYALTVILTNTLIVSATNAFSAEQWAGDISIHHTNTLTHNVATLHYTEGGTPTFQAINPLTGDPKLDTTYHLQDGSAAIDAGVDAGVTTDIDGEARPWGAGYDIGADEYTGGGRVGHW